MSKEELKYLFSESSCLTPKQMKRYVRGGMANEESYAVELHLSSCPFCNEAVEGLFEQREGNAADVATHLNGDFLKDHFSVPPPRVHLNSMAPAHHHPQPVVHVQPRKRRRLRVDSVWKPSGIAAITLLVLGTIWFAKQRQQLNNAQATNAAMAVVEQSEQENIDAGEKVLASADMVEIKDEPVSIQMASIEGQSQQPQLQQLPVQAVPPQPAAIAEKDIKKVEQKPIESKPKPSAPVRQEPIVSQYKAPLMDRPVQTPAETANAETVPVRTTAAAQPTTGGSYSDDGTHTAANWNQPREDAPLSADDLYNQKNYSAALNLYKQQMNAGGRGKRNYAALQAARCQLALGNRQSAIQLLQGIVSEGGNHKRAAKRLLEELGVDKGE